MRRNLVWVGAALVLCTLVVVPLGVASASPSRMIVGTGSPTCTGIVGKLMFSPPLKTAGTSTHEEVHVNGKVFGCTGGQPTPSSGKLVGKGIIHGTGSNKCSSYFPTGVMTFTSPGFFVEVEWVGGITATRVDFPTLTISNAAPTAPEVFTGGPTPVTGSYLPAETLSLSTVKTNATIVGATAGNCGSAGGLKKATFGAPSMGTF
jgi:hypothetical protein